MVGRTAREHVRNVGGTPHQSLVGEHHRFSPTMANNERRKTFHTSNHHEVDKRRRYFRNAAPADDQRRHLSSTLTPEVKAVAEMCCVYNRHSNVFSKMERTTENRRSRSEKRTHEDGDHGDKKRMRWPEGSPDDQEHRHQSGRSRTEVATVNPGLLNRNFGGGDCRIVHRNLQVAMCDAYARCNTTEAENKQVLGLLEAIEKLVPGTSVCLFGSAATKLSIPSHSDLDICISMPSGTKNPLGRMCRALRRTTRFQESRIIPARVPIIKTHDTFTNTAIDITTNPGGVSSSRMMMSWCEKYPEFAILSVCLKLIWIYYGIRKGN